MAPLAGTKLPTSAHELVDAIGGALRELFSPRGGEAPVRVEGESLAHLESISIRLDGAIITTDQLPPRPKGTGQRTPGPQVKAFELSGQPIHYQSARLNLNVSGADLQFDFDRDRTGRPLLVLTGAGSGDVDLRIDRRDVESLATEAARRAAQPQGIAIQDLSLDLRSAGPRSIEIIAQVKAKKMMFGGTIRVAGRVDVDPDLNARVWNLSCTGQGVVGAAAAGLVQARLAKYEGMTISLMAFSLGDVALRDLKIDLSGDQLHLHAAFGGA